MNSLSRFCWITAVVYVLVGMGFGIWMSITGDHRFAPAHAHLNLIGWVSIALLGTFYALVPQVSGWMISKIQVGLAQIAAITMFPGIIMAISGAGETLAKIGSLAAIAAMLLFLVIVIRGTRSA